MGVYIKGMEMPKNCKECFACKAELSQEKKVIYVCCFAQTDCPLVPVPPHGRCIDADLLCKVLQKNSEDEWNNKTAPFSWAYAYDCVKDTVENMPTIIEAEEGE